MRGYVLVADALERRAAERIEQLALDGWPARRARRPDDARELLAGAGLLVLGEFNGSAALAHDLVRDLRAGGVPGAYRQLGVISTADSEAQIISALAAGADLTVTRAASPSLISASVAALDRRGNHAYVPATIKVGGLELDPAGREARLDGHPVRLTPREMDMLVLLAQKPGRVFTRDEICWEVWRGPDIKTSRSLDAHMARMRQKFNAAGAGTPVIQNVHGVGYKLNPSPGGVER